MPRQKTIATCCQCGKTAEGKREVQLKFNFRTINHECVDGRITKHVYPQSRCIPCRTAHAKLVKAKREKEAKREARARAKGITKFSNAIHDMVAVGTAKRSGRKVNAPTVKRLYKKAYPNDKKARDTAYMRKKLGL